MKLRYIPMIVLLVTPALAAGGEKKTAATGKAAPPSAARPAVKPAAQAGPRPVTAAKPKPPANPAGNPTLPAGAVEVEPGLFKHSAANGEVWMYRRTPFGYSRYRPEKPLRDADQEEAQYLQATEQGDSVQFERKTPFGVNKWTRKKSELSGAERLALDRARQPGAAGAAAKSGQE